MSAPLLAISRYLLCFAALLLLAGCDSSDPAVTHVAPAAPSPVDATSTVDAASQSSSDSVNDAATVDALPAAAPEDYRAAAASTTEPSASDAAPAAASQPEPQPVEKAASDITAENDQLLSEVKGLTRLDPKYEVWIDPKQKRVLTAGEIVRREGQLEMFACLKNSKEHESIVAANTKAYIVNAGLMALGAEPGGPVQFRPEFKPASGPEVEVTVIYTDADGKRKEVRGQEWIRNIKTGKALDQPWVFGGSGFWVDESTGQRHFMAEDGDFVCISNFTSAMLDLPVESSQDSAELLFEAFTDRIPPVKTPVLLVLTPKLEAKKETAKEGKEATAP